MNTTLKFPIILLVLSIAVAIYFLFSFLGRFFNRDTQAVIPDTGSGAYSISAIGTLSLFQILKADRNLVERRIVGQPLPSSPNAALVVADPLNTFRKPGILNEIRQSPSKILLILPKWEGTPAKFPRQGWLTNLALVDPLIPETLVDLLLDSQSGSLIHRVTGPIKFSHNELALNPTFGVGPQGVQEVQLLQTHKLKPIVSGSEGILLGEFTLDRGNRVWVLADPDPVANHGLGQGDNLKFAIALIDLFTSDLQRGPLIFEESHLNATQSTSSFLSFHKAVILLLGLLIALAFLSLGSRRFWPIQRPPELQHGKSKLILNCARLLDKGGHQREIYLRYLNLVVDNLAKIFHAPPLIAKDKTALLKFLDQRLSHREFAPSALYRQAQSAKDSTDLKRLIAYAQIFHNFFRKTKKIGSRANRTNNPVHPLRSQ
ncbi:MAG: hypothetical protein LBF22_08915 [Deltaproteobacteria bacterium]|jgi:hypothetical protein|nr:hypothetical protein [Deltaproteobacteria bacterium]